MCAGAHAQPFLLRCPAFSSVQKHLVNCRPLPLAPFPSSATGGGHVAPPMPASLLTFLPEQESKAPGKRIRDYRLRRCAFVSKSTGRPQGSPLRVRISRSDQYRFAACGQQDPPPGCRWGGKSCFSYFTVTEVMWGCMPSYQYRKPSMSILSPTFRFCTAL